MCVWRSEVVIPVDWEESSSDDEEDGESGSDNGEGEDEDDYREELEEAENFTGEDEQAVDEKARVLQFLHVSELITAFRPRYALRRMYSWVWQRTPISRGRAHPLPNETLAIFYALPSAYVYGASMATMIVISFVIQENTGLRGLTVLAIAEASLSAQVDLV